MPLPLLFSSLLVIFLPSPPLHAPHFFSFPALACLSFVILSSRPLNQLTFILSTRRASPLDFSLPVSLALFLSLLGRPFHILLFLSLSLSLLFSCSQNGLLNASLYMTTCISLLASSHVSERMINERILTRTACRKVFLATGKYFAYFSLMKASVIFFWNGTLKKDEKKEREKERKLAKKERAKRVLKQIDTTRGRERERESKRKKQDVYLLS